MDVAITSSDVDFDSGDIDGREFYGLWKVKVVAVDPDFENIMNKVTVQLVKRIYTVIVKKYNQTDILALKKTDSYDTLVWKNKG